MVGNFQVVSHEKVALIVRGQLRCGALHLRPEKEVLEGSITFLWSESRLEESSTWCSTRVFNKVSVKATCWQPGLNCRHGGSLIGNPVGIITSLDLDLKPSSHKLPWLFKLQHYFFSQSTFAFGKSRKTKGNPGKSFYVCTVGSFLSPRRGIIFRKRYKHIWFLTISALEILEFSNIH